MVLCCPLFRVSHVMVSAAPPNDCQVGRIAFAVRRYLWISAFARVSTADICTSQAIRHVMNLFNYDLGRRCLIAEAWVVSSRLDEVGAALKVCCCALGFVQCIPSPFCE